MPRAPASPETPAPKSLTRRLLYPLAIVLFGISLGVSSAAFGLWKLVDATWLHNGPWRTNMKIGSKDADMYTRATVAIGGLLALNKSETIYFVASRDQQGAPLRSGCTYEVSGGAIAARWWSITLYGNDLFLIPNAPRRYAYTKRELQPKDAASSWRFVVSSAPQRGLWLPSGQGHRLTLTLRLYNPSRSILARLGSISLPTIQQRKGSCGGAR